MGAPCVSCFPSVLVSLVIMGSVAPKCLSHEDVVHVAKQISVEHFFCRISLCPCCRQVVYHMTMLSITKHDASNGSTDTDAYQLKM